MQKLTDKLLGVSIAMFAAGMLLVFAAAGDWIPYFLGDVVGAYLAFIGVAIGVPTFMWSGNK